MVIKKISEVGLNLIKSFEGLSLKPYPDPATGGLPITIGYGSTRYLNGTKITLNDPPISQAMADNLLKQTLVEYEKAVDALCRDDLNQNQFDALVSFAYNCGINNLKTSTLLKKVNANPNDPTIKDEFKKWDKAAGKVLKGLTRRRDEEWKHFNTLL